MPGNREPSTAQLDAEARQLGFQDYGQWRAWYRMYRAPDRFQRGGAAYNMDQMNRAPTRPAAPPNLQQRLQPHVQGAVDTAGEEIGWHPVNIWNYIKRNVSNILGGG